MHEKKKREEAYYNNCILCNNVLRILAIHDHKINQKLAFLGY